MKRNFLLIIALTLGASLNAQNPIVPSGQYCSDPSAHQWVPGGPIYVYGSRDESKNYYCSRHYDVWSSTDLKNWTCHPNSFSSVGENDGVPYNDNMLYAPDCLYRDGKYYLYYSQDFRGDAEGVAVSDSPTGPFRDGTVIKAAKQIDPAVFIDDDGTPYYFFGQFAGKMAQLKPDLKDILPETLKDSIITEADHAFHEGIQVVKRGEWYYLVYAHISRRGMPTCIGYSMSKNLAGPYEHKGVIIDNFGCDPGCWNNHGSIAEFNGQWYVFYHRSTGNSTTMRKACVEPITFNPDGTINEVEMTTQGASGPLDAFQKMDAERACYLTGAVRVELTSAHNEHLTHIQNGNTAAYKYLHFERTPQRITLELTPKAGGIIEVYANTLSRPLLATIRVEKGDGITPVTLTAEIDKSLELTGVHPIFLRFHGEEGQELFQLDWFQFQ